MTIYVYYPLFEHSLDVKSMEFDTVGTHLNVTSYPIIDYHHRQRYTGIYTIHVSISSSLNYWSYLIVLAMPVEIVLRSNAR